jgi:hypothetical protein
MVVVWCCGVCQNRKLVAEEALVRHHNRLAQIAAAQEAVSQARLTTARAIHVAPP